MISFSKMYHIHGNIFCIWHTHTSTYTQITLLGSKFVMDLAFHTRCKELRHTSADILEETNRFVAKTFILCSAVWTDTQLSRTQTRFCLCGFRDAASLHPIVALCSLTVRDALHSELVLKLFPWIVGQV